MIHLVTKTKCCYIKKTDFYAHFSNGFVYAPETLVLAQKVDVTLLALISDSHVYMYNDGVQIVTYIYMYIHYTCV